MYINIGGNTMQSVTEILGIKYPLIQAPMSWITDAKLVSSVSNSGGLGVLGPNAGQTTLTSDPIETSERMRSEIRKTKKLTKKPFGINIILGGENKDNNNPFLETLLKISFEENIKYFVTVGETNKKVFDLIKGNGGTIIHRPLTPTVARMKNAESLGVDILVATGFDEGGVIPERSLGTFTAIPVMVDAVNIPVLAAGGINDVRGVNAAFAFGAQGVYIGTAFITTKESPASEETKLKIINSTYDDMLSVSPTQRSIKTKKALKFNSYYEDPSYEYNLDEQIRISGGARPSMLEGKIDEGIISVNTGIDLLSEITDVKSLIEQFMNEKYKED